jgi:hypothetical protein
MTHAYKIVVRKSNGRYQLIELGVDESIFKRIINKIGYGDMDWIYVAQDRVQGRALVKSVMSFQIS